MLTNTKLIIILIVKLLVIIITTVLLTVLVGDYFQPYDDTDDVANGKRSGFILYTDHLTGCQYLRAGMLGGTVVRRDKDGNHVGCRL